MPTPASRNPLITLLSIMVLIGLAIIGFIALSYILIAMAVIGLALFTISFIRSQWTKRFGSSTQKHTRPQPGRVIDHDDT